MPTLRLALDRSARYYDADGRLHVRLNNISKANVCPYRGAEIPGYEELGLDPDKIYKLLRDPDELAKAAPTFNNLPLLDQHVPVSADEHMPELVVGSLGTDAAFNAPYLQNSLVIWAAGAIAGVEADKIKELSAAYRYTVDMSPGEFEGVAYDGVMRNIRGNHVALVEAGRAGSDVVVGDSQLQGTPPMPVKLKSRKAVMLNGALSVHLHPRLAQDAKIDLTPILAGVTAANFASKKAAIVAGVAAAAKGKLAQDADIGDVVALLDAVGDVNVEGPDLIPDEPAADPVLEEEPPAVDADGDVLAKVMAFLQGKLSDEDMAALSQLCGPGAADTPPPFEGKPEDPGSEGPNMPTVDKPAMDRAIKAVENSTVNRITAMLAAREAVKPWVGELVAMDSADAIYKSALELLKVDVTGVHPSAYRHILDAQPKPGEAPANNVIAMDASASKDFETQFPGAARIRRA